MSSFGLKTAALTLSSLLVSLNALSTGDRQEALDTHNELRRLTATGIHVNRDGTPMLRAADMNYLLWDNCLETVAQAYIDTVLVPDAACPLVHNPNRGSAYDTCLLPGTHSGGVGENAFKSSGDLSNAVALEQAVSSWTNEKDFFYMYSDGLVANQYCGVGKVCGHYTQVVWAETTHVGCGVGHCSGGGTVVFCNYAKAGNMVGQIPYTPALTAGAVASACPGAAKCDMCIPDGASCFDNTGGTAGTGRDVCHGGFICPTPEPTPQPTPQPTPGPTPPPVEGGPVCTPEAPCDRTMEVTITYETTVALQGTCATNYDMWVWGYQGMGFGYGFFSGYWWGAQATANPDEYSIKIGYKFHVRNSADYMALVDKCGSTAELATDAVQVMSKFAACLTTAGEGETISALGIVCESLTDTAAAPLMPDMGQPAEEEPQPMHAEKHKHEHGREPESDEFDNRFVFEMSDFAVASLVAVVAFCGIGLVWIVAQAVATNYRRARMSRGRNGKQIGYGDVNSVDSSEVDSSTVFEAL